MTKLLPYLLNQDEILMENDLIEEKYVDQSQYAKTIPNVINSNEIDLLNDDEEFILREMDFDINNESYSNMDKCENVTQKFVLPIEFEEQWDDINDDEIFQDF